MNALGGVTRAATPPPSSDEKGGRVFCTVTQQFFTSTTRSLYLHNSKSLQRPHGGRTLRVRSAEPHPRLEVASDTSRPPRPPPDLTCARDTMRRRVPCTRRMPAAGCARVPPCGYSICLHRCGWRARELQVISSRWPLNRRSWAPNGGRRGRWPDFFEVCSAVAVAVW